MAERWLERECFVCGNGRPRSIWNWVKREKGWICPYCQYAAKLGGIPIKNLTEGQWKDRWLKDNPSFWEKGKKLYRCKFGKGE